MPDDQNCMFFSSSGDLASGFQWIIRYPFWDVTLYHLLFGPRPGHLVDIFRAKLRFQVSRLRGVLASLWPKTFGLEETDSTNFTNLANAKNSMAKRLSKGTLGYRHASCPVAFERKMQILQNTHTHTHTHHTHTRIYVGAQDCGCCIQ